MFVRIRIFGGLGFQVIKTLEFVRQTPKDTGWGLSLDSLQHWFWNFFPFVM